MCFSVMKLLCMLLCLLLSVVIHVVLGHVENEDGSLTFASKTIYATEYRIRIDDKVELSTQRCALIKGLEALVFNEIIRGDRLVKTQLENGSAGESTVNEDLLAKHKLENISPSLNCSVVNNSVVFEVSWQLEILGATLNHPRFKKIVVVVNCRDKDDVDLRNDVLYIIIYNQTAGTSGTVSTVPADKPTSNPTASTGTGSTVPAHKPASNPTASTGTGSTVPASNPTASTGEAKVKNSIQKTILIAVSCASFVGLLVLIIIIIVICVIRRREGPSRTFRAKKKPIWSANVVEIAPV